MRKERKHKQTRPKPKTRENPRAGSNKELELPKNRDGIPTGQEVIRLSVRGPRNLEPFRNR